MATQDISKQSVQARSNTSRNEAVRRLVAEHQEEYETYLLEERKKRGLFGLPGARPASVRQQLQTAQEQVDRMHKILEEMGVQFNEDGIPISESI